MIVSQARIDANRKNAKLSTGPRSEEGKRKSRANALQHGLCASVCVPEDLELVQQRSRELFDTLKPQNELHVWMVEHAAIATIRIDHCERMERRSRDTHSLKAELTWDDDRRLEAEVLGRSLAFDPSETITLLQKTPQGCEWLMARWAMLAYSANVQEGKWTEDQTKLAFDLLGTPIGFRKGRKPGLMLDFEGNVLDSGDDAAAVARREVGFLKEKREVVSALDEVERTLAATDLSNEGNPELRRLRRYESTLFGRLRWYLKQITIQSPYRVPDSSLRPKWALTLEDETEALSETPAAVSAKVAPSETVLSPPELEVEKRPEPAREIERPKILSARREKQVRRTEARREARKRVADKLRA